MLTASARSAEIYKPLPGETCDYRVKDSAGAKIEGIVIPDNGEYCISVKRMDPQAERPNKIAPSEPTPAERIGPQFLYGWSQKDVDTITSAFAKMEDEHLTLPGGYDDYLMARRARILNKLSAGFMFYDENWKEMHLTLLGPDGAPWWIVHTTLPETILTGTVVSRDRYCAALDQDTDDMLMAEYYCENHNRAAIELFGRIEQMKHMTPGGAAPRP